jgi:hypothetical protein
MNSREIEEQRLLLAINRSTGGVTTNVPVFSTGETAPDDTTSTNTSLIDNLIDNSDFDYSKDGYLNPTPAGGDVALEVYNFYRNRLIRVTDVSTTNGSPTVNSVAGEFKAAYTYPMSFLLYGAGASGETLTGTLTRVSDTQATLSTNALVTLTNATLWFGDTLGETAAQAIKATGHSLFAAETANANIPRWAKTDGWIEMGSTTSEQWSVDTPFFLNVIRPGRTIFVICIVSRRVGAAMNAAVPLYFGVWDDTPAQNRWLEGSNFDLSVTPVGTTGATSVSYKAIAVLSDGSTIESDVVTIANSNAVLSGANYNRLTWTNAPGILDFKLYRLMGGVYHRIFTITNGANDYNDTGGNEATETGFPVTHNTKAVAYKQSSPVLPVENSWVAVGVVIQIASTYNTQNTTAKQWFRAGAAGTTADARAILFDRLGVSFLQGGWNRSSRDRALIANQNPDSSPTGSNQGNTGVGTCFDKTTLVKHREKGWIPLGDIDRGDYIWDGSRGWVRVTHLKRTLVGRITLAVMSNGAWCLATESERFVTSRADKDGTMLCDLTIGDQILAPSDSGVTRPTIIGLQELNGEFEVITPSLQGGKKIFAVGNYTDNGVQCLLAHNEKPQPGNEF